MTQFLPWHVIGNPILETQNASIYTFPQNITWALQKAIDTLKFKPKTLKNDLEKSIFLRWIFHLIGDIHQPLHAASRYTD